ncbi:unnamed protein product [Microthlaspi erraticum]|uniref:Aspartic peptidase DDI1-type domain-containing protein n=1 Tax=Microthlaspi erraticum TaxID=1685480 RepID=A0A6D2ICY7_9BRAS|nr:unnamed protein product [Microthlaspi erraticum]
MPPEATRKEPPPEIIVENSEDTSDKDNHEELEENVIPPPASRVFKPKVKIAKKSQNGAKESNHQVPKSRAPKSTFLAKDQTGASEIAAVLSKTKIPEKLYDPGRFVLSCNIGGTTFKRSLCYLGSSVNLMPYIVAKRLGIPSFRPTKIQFVFADRSVRRPVGVVTDVQVMIEECYIPADFVVLKLDQEPRDPLILGRRFLATVGAIIDVTYVGLGEEVKRAKTSRTLPSHQKNHGLN